MIVHSCDVCGGVKKVVQDSGVTVVRHQCEAPQGHHKVPSNLRELYHVDLFQKPKNTMKQ